MRTNYVLIDYESVQPEDLSALKHDHFRVIVFVGAHQNKIAYETVAALQQLGSNAEYVKISGTGQNALDFHIAFYIGQLAGREPEACFHIVSKDTGFDPLISHLKTRKLRALRVKTISDIPLLKAGNAKSTPDKIALIVNDLGKRGAAKPRTVATLTSTIGALFLKQLSPDEISALLKALQELGHVSVSGNKVTYNLPT
ncbi:MAG: PIN domain-containing protein [Acidobacteriota bacterium]|nr:PIN domain-containing protein [Acidobacteriota bacterium]